MAKKRNRRRKGDASGAEAVAGIAAIVVVANGFVAKDVVNFLLSTLGVLLLVGVMFWFVKGMIQPNRKSVQLVRDLVRHDGDQGNEKVDPIKGDHFNVPEKVVSSRSMPLNWSVEVLREMDWRLFEKLCVRLWEVKGFSAKETASGADGGVDFYLYAGKTDQKIGAVQCKTLSKGKLSVKVVRELQGVVAAEKLKLGLLMYSGKLSNQAEEFLNNPAVTVKAQGAEEIINELEKLDVQIQAQLFKELITSDYAVPSCPKCDQKLVKRLSTKSGHNFWGCSNFPRCRYTLNGGFSKA